MELTVIEENLLETILGEIFSTMVPLPLERVSGDPIPSPFSGATTIINISNESHRFVLVFQASERLACKIYGAMLGEEASKWNASVADAYGEVGNMTAGALKTALGIPGLMLSIPSVIKGAGYDWSAPGVKIAREDHFISEGEPLILRVGESVE